MDSKTQDAAAQPVGRWEEAPRYVWICLCGVRWNRSVADCSKCRSVRPKTAVETREHPTHRWNFKPQDDGSLLICRGLHEKGDKCDWERFAAALSASQEPRGEPSAWARAAVESAKQEVAEAYDAGGERAISELYKTLDLIFTRKLGRGFDPECESIACAVECALDAARASER